MTIVRHEKFIKSDLTHNNNKFWEVEVHDSGDVICRWGRVGDSGQNKTFSTGSLDSANSLADKKIREKTSDGRNGEIAYRKIETVGSISPVAKKQIDSSELHKIASKQIKTNNPIVDELVRYLTTVNAHNILSATGGKVTFNDVTGLFSTPLGIVTQKSIDEANKVLIDIANIVAQNNLSDSKMINLTNDYLMLIPHDFGHKRLNIPEFWGGKDSKRILEEKAILDGLQTSYAQAILKKDTQTEESKDEVVESVFNVKLDLLDDKKIISKLTKKYEESKKDMHIASRYKIKQIFNVNIAGERDLFEKEGKKVGNVNQFFHGSSSQNLLSILKQGLMIPPKSSPHVCGRMFGDGIYTAPSSSKSLNYSLGVWGSKKCDRVFMFLADVAMGKSYTPRSSNDGPFPRSGFDSVWAKSGQSGVMNDECIVYSLKQCSLTHLLELYVD